MQIHKLEEIFVALEIDFRMMPITLNQPNGLHIVTQATLAQLSEDEALRAFADGLLQTALVHTINFEPSTFNLPYSWPKRCTTLVPKFIPYSQRCWC